ncbi:MAG: NADH-quinone oxidoreductase subunit NuoK [Deltaproteobacteria bacterium]|jgi:NADH-quinone oxidoreductase subunit K|nr:NADH-quinone oxidoreductase subunit NuoK [Deltaproteobacteria bacterium]MBW2519516.1 NADH-quinone oxidoreductase subunit NuoK [Deltaproteobacteria bacterium]
MIVPIGHVLACSAALFAIGLTCAVIRRQIIMILIGVEIMLNAAALAFVGGSAFWQQVDGQVFVVFLMAITAAEVAVALAMVVYLHQRKRTMIADEFNRMSG